ncbi:histidine kinase [Streptomyces sp. XM4193]|nr:histidine kinase [Streptomyces sp. XM4193]
MRAAGTVLGCLSGVLALLYFAGVGLVLGPLLLRSRTREPALVRVEAGARRLVVLERRRRFSYFQDHYPPRAVNRAQTLRYLALHGGTGLAGSIMLTLLFLGCVLAGALLAGVVQGGFGLGELLLQILLGSVLLLLNLQGLVTLAEADAGLARMYFGPSERELLTRRIEQLASSRAAVVHAVDAERRRIERDLHDGVQQRLVAMGMLLGRARRGRDPAQADALLAQAHREAQEVITELREVTWRVYPTALDSLGLEEALGGVAERCGIPLRLDFAVDRPLPGPVEIAAYFVVSEAVTNAAKHARATELEVGVLQQGPVLRVFVRDDGVGGAQPDGSGLTGLRSRVAALDGEFAVSSPPGGPTIVEAELPCG